MSTLVRIQTYFCLKHPILGTKLAQLVCLSCNIKELIIAPLKLPVKLISFINLRYLPQYPQIIMSNTEHGSIIDIMPTSPQKSLIYIPRSISSDEPKSTTATKNITEGTKMEDHPEAEGMHREPNRPTSRHDGVNNYVHPGAVNLCYSGSIDVHIREVSKWGNNMGQINYGTGICQAVCIVGIAAAVVMAFWWLK